MPDAFLNVAAVRRRTRVNGPGWRAAVWVQGCTIGCPGCFNPDTHPHQPRQLWDPDRLAEHMVEGELEGISILGGEPFEQAAACARLARRARDLGASVVTYSGYMAASLRTSTLPEVHALLAATDLLIAGPYVARHGNNGRGWHGSTNQELVFLTSRYNEGIRAQFDVLEVVELRTDGTAVDWTGIPSAADTETLYNLGRRR